MCTIILEKWIYSGASINSYLPITATFLFSNVAGYFILHLSKTFLAFSRAAILKRLLCKYFFLFLQGNIYHGYSLELPHKDTSGDYPHSCCYLTHCRLNRLSHTIYWKSPISILGICPAMRFTYS